MAMPLGEFAEAVFEGFGKFEAVGDIAMFRGEDFDEVIVEDMAVAGGVASGGLDLEPRDAEGPGKERLLGLVFGGLAPEDEVGFLHDVIGEHPIGEQREDVAVDLRLVPSDQADNAFLGVGWVSVHLLPILPRWVGIFRGNFGKLRAGPFSILFGSVLFRAIRGIGTRILLRPRLRRTGG